MHIYTCKITILYFIILNYLAEGIHVPVRLWRSEGTLEAILTFHHVGAENQIEFSRLGYKLS